MTRITVRQGDITKLRVDAIVNAANPALAPGGGVCGAIHSAAGPDLARACAALPEVRTGDAVMTPGYDLPADHVIHAVGPVWHGGDSGEAELLASCYRRALEIAAEAGLRTVAFPAISTGIFGYPPDRAARVAVDTVATTVTRFPGIEEVIFCCFDAESAARHRAALAKREDGE